MVEVELDAARALADMAGIGERSRKRAKNESPDPDSVRAKGSHGSEAEAEKEAKNVQLNAELSKLGIHCSASKTPLVGSRGKQNLTEAEKEAKRQRRVLANRESARQTIRRRQALREELTRKVADLSLENQNMKTEKEIVMKEYLALKDTNKKLKDQKIESDIAVKTEPAPQPVQTTVAPPTKLPVTLHSTPPLVPYIWRSWPARGTCYEQGNPSVSGPGPPFSLPPCTWFYPLVHEVPQPSALYSHTSRDQYVQSSSAQHSFEENRPSPVVKEEEEEEEVPCSLTLAIDEVKKATIYGKAEERALKKSQVSETNSDKVVQVSSCMNLLSSLDIQRESASDQHVKNVEREETKGGCSYSHEKSANTAEARKRRKELTKLKQTHGRQFGFQ